MCIRDRVPPAQVLVEDSQIEMPLGPDRALESDEDEADANDGLDQDGRPRKVWKKKGQKRTTRRVIMRPGARPKHSPSNEAVGNTALATIPETQLLEDPVAEIDAANSKSDEGDADYNDAIEDSRPAKTTSQTDQGQKSQAEGGIVKKAARKISAVAHANFCKLKIKNKNSKAKGRGRFGRR